MSGGSLEPVYIASLRRRGEVQYADFRGMNSGDEGYGVWLSLARAPALGAGGRKFESCHPDFRKVHSYVSAGVVQW